jgi:transposase
MLTAETHRLQPASAADPEKHKSDPAGDGRTIASIDVHIDAHLRTHHAVATDFLNSIKGVGQSTIASLVASLPELGHVPGKRLSALAGLAPLNCDSGQQQGQHQSLGRQTGGAYLALHGDSVGGALQPRLLHA